LKYVNSFPAIADVKRVSKPGQRIYIGYNKIFPKGRDRTRIISTSKGVMTDVEAKKNKLGGEVLCEIS
ncbi:MAG: 30S ribosomal protein S8, partial [Patescibacteria group bacterium]